MRPILVLAFPDGEAYREALSHFLVLRILRMPGGTARTQLLELPALVYLPHINFSKRTRTENLPQKRSGVEGSLSDEMKSHNSTVQGPSTNENS